MNTRFTAIAGLLGILLASAGCVERTISITSNPSGALVYLNDKEVGRTPVTTPFLWYGTYDVRLEADGYEPLWTTAKARQPLWDLPGPDLIAEAIPDARSEIKWHFEMQPAGPVDREALLDRAGALRQEVASNGAEEKAGDATDAGPTDDTGKAEEEATTKDTKDTKDTKGEGE